MSTQTPYQKKEMSPKLKKRLATYSAAANVAVLSGLVLSGVTHAASRGRDITDVTLSTDGAALQIDFDDWTLPDDPISDPEFTINFVTPGPLINIEPETFTDDTGARMVAVANNPYLYAKALDRSIDVSSGRTDWLPGISFTLGYGSLYGEFPGAGDKYIGVEFDLIETSGVHYGWILLNVAPDSSSVTIKEYGYNTTPGDPIPTAVSLTGMGADASAPWWRQAAIAVFAGLSALSLWARRRVGRASTAE